VYRNAATATAARRQGNGQLDGLKNNLAKKSCNQSQNFGSLPAVRSNALRDAAFTVP
jgi:hypothetical protein